MVIEFTGDCSVFPSDIQAALAALAAEDRRHVRIQADHFGRALDPGGPGGISAAAKELASWAEDGASK
jgi:hypothetical protein